MDIAALEQCSTRCPHGEEQGLTPERIKVQVSMTTAAYVPPFCDSEGKYHHHGTNHCTENLECSNGHCFTRIIPYECWCGWRQDKEDSEKTSITWTANAPLDTTVEVDAYGAQDAMWEIIKAVADGGDPNYCSFCRRHNNSMSNLKHDDNCVVIKAYNLVWQKHNEEWQRKNNE